MAGPSGIPVPSGNLADLKLVHAEGFDTAVALGGWPGPYGATYSSYDTGWDDTAGSTAGANSGYDNGILSVENSCLHWHLQVKNGRVLSANVSPKASRRLYGRFDVCLKATGGVGWKTAFLLWPDSGQWPRDGEIDFPEGDFGGNVEGYMHRQGATSGGDQDQRQTSVTHREWHVYTIDWRPNRLQFLLDGQPVGAAITSRVPNTSMHWQFQVEKQINNNPVAASATGDVLVDWAAVYEYAPGTKPDNPPPPPPPPPAGTGTLTLVFPAAPTPTSVARGGTLVATATYRNATTAPMTVQFAALSLRGPGGERMDLTDFKTNTVVAAGADFALVGLRPIPLDAATGTWGVVGTWQGADGAWHESAATPFAVVAAPPPPPPPPPPDPNALTPMDTTGATPLERALAENVLGLDRRLRKAGW